MVRSSSRGSAPLTVNQKVNLHTPGSMEVSLSKSPNPEELTVALRGRMNSIMNSIVINHFQLSAV